MPLSLTQLQTLIRQTYHEKDQRRGVEGTFMWFMEEVGELAAALRSGSAEERRRGIRRCPRLAGHAGEQRGRGPRQGSPGQVRRGLSRLSTNPLCL